MKNNKKAFTLVELIVVVSILSVLGTIAFISLQGYSSYSRNSVRITDLGTIEQSLGIFEINSGFFPLPSKKTNVIYSGTLLWFQGLFGEDPYLNLANISKLPIDPLYDIQYDYSVLHNKRKFQLSTIIEGSFFSYDNLLISSTYALGKGDINSYVTGNYYSKDIISKTIDNCILISIPSLNINNLPIDGVLELFGDYSFIYSNSNNISKNYIDNIEYDFTLDTFKIKDVLNKCSINTIDELNLYISKISLIYQQLIGNNLFDEVIYNFDTSSFRRGVIDELIFNGINVNLDLIEEILNPSAGNIFRDTFTSIDTIDISNNHTPDTYGNWSGDNSYAISSNKLIKTLNSNGFLSIIPVLPVTSIDRTILFNIIDFNFGDIYIYSQYTDINNFQGVKLNSNGYIRMKMEGGIYSEYDNILINIVNNSSIEFSVIGNTIRLLINGIDQGDIIDPPILDNSNTTIKMSEGVIIDDFHFIYK